MGDKKLYQVRFTIYKSNKYQSQVTTLAVGESEDEVEKNIISDDPLISIVDVTADEINEVDGCKIVLEEIIGSSKTK